jgi:hypothetical protein
MEQKEAISCFENRRSRIRLLDVHIICVQKDADAGHADLLHKHDSYRHQTS